MSQYHVNVNIIIMSISCQYHVNIMSISCQYHVNVYVKLTTNQYNINFSMFSGGFPLVSFTLPGAPQTGSLAEQR